MSFFMRATVGAISIAQKVSALTGRKLPTTPEKSAKQVKLPNYIYEKYGSYFRTIEGATVVRLDPESYRHPNELIYLHGGGYTQPINHMHWGIVDRLMVTTRSRALVPQYLLAPEHTAAEVYPLLDKVYDLAQQRVQQRKGKIVIAGDSAGGGLALAYAMNRRDRKLSLPDQLILFSPWLDVTLQNPEIKTIKDPMLKQEELTKAGRDWAGEWDVKDPRISPLFGSSQDLPLTLIYQGKQDILYPDVRVFSETAQQEGAPIKLMVAPTGFHVYMALPYLPESRQVYREIRGIFKT